MALPLRNKTKSFIYLIYSEIGFMIGKSSDVHRRFAVIDAYSPIELRLFRVYKIDKNGSHERRIYKKYEDKGIRGGWFAIDYEDIEEIDKYLLENKGTRILDNREKILSSHPDSSADSEANPYHQIHDDIEKLEDVVKKLKGTLNGRHKF